MLDSTRSIAFEKVHVIIQQQASDSVALWQLVLSFTIVKRKRMNCLNFAHELVINTNHLHILLLEFAKCLVSQ